MKTVFGLLPALFILGCGSINDSRFPGDATFVKDARLQSAQGLPEVSLAIVKTAESNTREALFYSGGSWLKSRVGAHSAVLVRHPQGSFLFDTGLGQDMGRQFNDNMPFWLKPSMVYKNHQSAQTLLANEIKHRPIQKILLSHLHWDHASGIKDFPGVEVWTTKAEYEAAMSPNAHAGGYIPSQYSGAAIPWRFIQFERVAYENFAQSLDLFRDGSEVLVPLPGHTPGAMGMFVNLPSGKRLFFTGDTTWTVEGFQLPAHKFWGAALWADQDKSEIERSILKIRRLMQEYPEMLIVPTHDDRAQSALGFYPKFIH